MKRGASTLLSALALVLALGLFAPCALAAPAVTVKYNCLQPGITDYAVPLYYFGARLTATSGVVKLTETKAFEAIVFYLDYTPDTIKQNMAFRAVKLGVDGRSMSEEELSGALDAMRTPAGYAVPGEDSLTFTLTVKPVFAALARTDPYRTSTIAVTTVKNKNTGASMADSRSPEKGDKAKGVAADVGEVVVVTPQPYAGWVFKNWSMKFYPYALGASYDIESYSALPAQCAFKQDPLTNAIEYTMPSGNVVAVAMYEPGTLEHTLKFDLNGGMSSDSAGSQTLLDGQKAARPPDPSKNGFRFGGWFTDNASFENEWDFDTAMHGALNQTITLYARWIETGRTFSFAAGSGGGTAPGDIKLEEGESVNLPANTFINAGHIFAGWKAGASIYLPGFSFRAPGNDVTFTAQWLQNTACSFADVSNSLLGIEDAKAYRPQIAAALEALKLLVTKDNAVASLPETGPVEALYKSAYDTAVFVSGGASSGVSTQNAAFSANGSQSATLTFEPVAQANRKPISQAYEGYCVAAFDIALKAGGASVENAAVPVVVRMPVPDTLKDAANITALLYCGSETPETAAPTLESGGLTFALERFGHVYIVGEAEAVDGGGETEPPDGRKPPDETQSKPGTTESPSVQAGSAARQLWEKLGQKTSPTLWQSPPAKVYGGNASASGYDRNGYPAGRSPNVKQAGNANAAVGTICAPPAKLQKALKKLGKSKGVYEIKNAAASLSFTVGNAQSARIRLMEYDETKGAFAELARDSWTLAGGLLVTEPLPPGVYGVLVK